MTINEKIKNRRLELGLSLEDVAQKLGVAKSTVYRYETEEIKNMGADKIAALARVLQLSPGYLMGWEGKDSNLYYHFKSLTEDLDLSEDDIDFLVTMAQKIARKKGEGGGDAGA